LTEAFPLQWPEGWARTVPHKRARARYKLTPESALKHLLDELRRLGAFSSAIVVSTNVPLRRDGLPYAGVRPPEDPGVAVYWSTRAFKDRVIACDKWDRVHDNIHAIGLAIEGLRAMERAGATQILDRAFAAFGALPPSSQAEVIRPFWEVFEIPQTTLAVLSLAMVEARYRELAAKAHPDKGGSDAAMAELNRAREDARRHYGGGT
jgi:hypothetical protein